MREQQSVGKKGNGRAEKLSLRGEKQMKTNIKYIIRNTTDKEPIITFNDEKQAINKAGEINHKHNKDIAEVVKVVTTIETSVII